MKVKYNGIEYPNKKDAFDDFLNDINFDDTEFRTKAEAYKWFLENEVK